MIRKFFNCCFVFLFFLASCALNKPDCEEDPNSVYNENNEECECKEGFELIGAKCECEQEGYVLVNGACEMENNEELFDTWDAHEECDQAGTFDYEMEIKESPFPEIILIHNLFEIDQDIECRLKPGGCDFFGDPEINGFDVVGEVVWDSDISTLQIDYTIKGTAEERCSAYLTKS